MGDMANHSIAYSGVKNSLADANHEGEFGVSVENLRALMDLRSVEALHRIQECFGDVQGLCTRLKTSPIEGNFCIKYFFGISTVMSLFLLVIHALNIRAVQ
uniref:Uncharacterized protein n=1 Tax=Latimeria chalumnae TaxID=7897 RepID=H3A9C0_LATCH